MKTRKSIPKLLLPQWIFCPFICMPLVTILPKKSRGQLLTKKPAPHLRVYSCLNKLSLYFITSLHHLRIPSWWRKNLKFTANSVITNLVLVTRQAILYFIVNELWFIYYKDYLTKMFLIVPLSFFVVVVVVLYTKSTQEFFCFRGMNYLPQVNV